jgi:hypothetical protein
VSGRGGERGVALGGGQHCPGDAQWCEALLGRDACGRADSLLVFAVCCYAWDSWAVYCLPS